MNDATRRPRAGGDRGAWILCLALAVGAAAFSACAAGDASEPPRRNVVLVVVDSLRADHLGLHGYGRPTSPFLDRLAGSSVVYERAYAPSSFTSQSTAALMTGRLPSSGGSIGLLEAQPMEGADTLAQRYRLAGFRTGLVSSQPLLRARGFTRGFEDIQVVSTDAHWSAGEAARRALDFVDVARSAGGEAPFFLHLHLIEPHQPYAPPPETRLHFAPDPLESPADVPELQAEIESGTPFRRDDPRMQELIARYDAEIRAVDAALEQLLAGLEERGLHGETALVVTGSHGEELLDHGYLGHAWTLFEEVLRVPLILHAPGLLEAHRVEEPVSLVDLTPSLLALSGIDAAGASFDGVGFLDLSEGPARVRPSRGARIAELVIRERCILRAVVDERWKYLSAVRECPLGERRSLARAYPELVRAAAEGRAELPELWDAPTRERLFRLDADPGEREDLAESEPEALARLRAVLANYAAHCHAHGLSAATPVVPAEVLDPGTVERLESLGYL